MKILICDDHQIVRDGIKQILQQLEGLPLISEASSGDEAMSLMGIDSFDMVLLIFHFPTRVDLTSFRRLKQNGL